MQLITQLFQAVHSLARTSAHPSHDLSRLTLIREKKFRSLITHAYDHVPFYRRLFQKEGISPGDLRGLGDLRKIPVLSREVVQRLADTEQVDSRQRAAGLINLRTSGSSGKNLDIYISGPEYIKRLVAWKRAFGYCGINWFDKTVEIATPREFPEKITLRHGLGLVREYSVFNDPARLCALCRSFRPRVIVAYASALKAMACESRNEPSGALPLKAVVSFAEYLNENDRELLQTVFRTKVLNYYAANEVGLIAWECRCQDGLHIDHDNIIVEILRPDGSPAGEGEEGDIVVTSLNSFAMPFIRYALGDRGFFHKQECSCRVSFPLLKVSAGRMTRDLVLPSGKRVTYWQLIDAFERVAGLLHYQIIQPEPARIVIRCVFDTSLSPVEQQALVRSAGRGLFGPDVVFEQETVKEIGVDRSGKYTMVVPLGTPAPCGRGDVHDT